MEPGTVGATSMESGAERWGTGNPVGSRTSQHACPWLWPLLGSSATIRSPSVFHQVIRAWMSISGGSGAVLTTAVSRAARFRVREPTSPPGE
ncbi:hypothetical protein GCM10022205_58200 [Spinactinospora alkalitolerans]